MTYSIIPKVTLLKNSLRKGCNTYGTIFSLFFEQYGELLLQGTWDTIVMTLVSTVFAYIIGIPLGVAVILTDPKKGLLPNRVVSAVLGWIINIGTLYPVHYFVGRYYSVYSFSGRYFTRCSWCYRSSGCFCGSFCRAQMVGNKV